MSTKVERNTDGTYKRGGPSPNPLGRAAGGKSSKNKVSLNKLQSLYSNLNGEAIEILSKMLREAYANGDINNAIKIAVFIAGKHYDLTIYQNKVEIEESKAKKQASEDDNNEDGDEAPQVVVTFPRHSAEG